MRGRDDEDDGLSSYVRLEDRVPADHPLPSIRSPTGEVSAAMDGRFEAMYSPVGRASIRTDAGGADRL